MFQFLESVIKRATSELLHKPNRLGTRSTENFLILNV